MVVNITKKRRADLKRDAYIKLRGMFPKGGTLYFVVRHETDSGATDIEIFNFWCGIPNRLTVDVARLLKIPTREAKHARHRVIRLPAGCGALLRDGLEVALYGAERPHRIFLLGL